MGLVGDAPIDSFPYSGLISRYRSYDPVTGTFPDLRGDSLRTIYPLQHILGDGVGYLANAALIGTETVVSKNGTAAVAVEAGKVAVGIGTLWSFVLSNGSTYESASKTGAASAVCFDTSGNGRHLVLTSFIDVPTACATSMSVGSDWLNQKGWSKRENRLNPSIMAATTSVSISALADGYYALAKLLTSTGQVISGYTLKSTYHPLAQNTSYIARITLQKLPGSATNSLSMGFYEGGWSGMSVTKISGPGTVAMAGWVNVSGLVEGVDTVIEIVKNNYIVGGAAPILNIYVTGLTAPSTRIGDGVIIKNFQVCAGATSHDYTSVSATPYVEQPSTLRGIPLVITKLVCIGDSLVAGFLPYIRTLLPDSTVVDAGVPGQTSTQILARFQSAVIDAGATQCILIAGTNDPYTSIPIATTKANILACIALADAHSIPITLTTLTPQAGFGSWTTAVQAFADELNPWIKTLGKPVADMYTAWRDGATNNILAAYDGGDHLHPSILGMMVEANTFFGVMPLIFIPGDVFNSPLQHTGRAKYPITATGQFATGSNFTLSAAPQLFAALGSGGVFDANGVPITVSFEDLVAANDDVREFFESKAGLIYEADLTGSNVTRASRYVGV